MTSKPTTNGNGAEPAFSAFLSAPGFLLSQKLALEAARFSAQRMRAYADQFETLAKCQNAGEIIEAQQKFLTRLQEEYAGEAEAMQQLIAAPPRDDNAQA